MAWGAAPSPTRIDIRITDRATLDGLEHAVLEMNKNFSATSRGILIGLLSAFGSALLVAVILGITYFLRYTSRGRILLDRLGRPGEYDDEQAFVKEEAQALEEMDDIQRAEYMRAKAFVQANPPESAQTDISLSQFLAIQEKGVSAWEFEPELEVANCFVEGRTEIEFFDSECSVQSNLPVPKQNEVYYWEAKIYDMPATTTIGIGMTTKPYPLFRLPGYHRTSVAYLSPGTRRLNQPFYPTAPYGPSYVRGDVIGVGYRPRSGTVFFTRNGKKLDDVTHSLKTQNLFPTVGATGPCTVHVNFGQMGFVFIEANVKKWGLAPLTGSLAPPPPYGSEQGSILLEGGQHGVPEGQGWLSVAGGAWTQGHARVRSTSMRTGRHQPTSPGPQRSPTDISLAQLSLVESMEALDAHDHDAGEGTSSSTRSITPGFHPAAPLNDAGLGIFTSQDAMHADAPPPEYTSPTEEELDRMSRAGSSFSDHERYHDDPDEHDYHDEDSDDDDDDDRSTPRPRTSSLAPQQRIAEVEVEARSKHNRGRERGRRNNKSQGSASPPIPSYDVAIGSVPGPTPAHR